MFVIKPFLISAITAVATLIASGLSAEEVHGDWTTHVKSTPKECYAVSVPQNTKNTRGGRVVDVKRGDILLYATYKPSELVSGLVSFTGGYPFKKESTVRLQIDNERFDLFTDGEWAWPNKKDDARLFAAMKKGAKAVLTASSERGTKTVDTFSLSGFTAATNSAKAACAN